MIFLTLGTQLAFDRLVRAVDVVAEDLEEEIIGQIGNSSYQPQNFKPLKFMEQLEFNEYFEKSRVVIGHAGIGTILSAMRGNKPLIMMARKASLNEHRNDHQRATVEQFGSLPGLYVVETASDIKEVLSDSPLEPMTQAVSPARTKLIEALRESIF